MAPLIFSMRDILTYLWGQRPTLSAFVYTPMIIYCYYTYLNSLKDNPKPIYLYVMMFLIAAQFYFHIQGTMLTVLALLIYTLFWSIKEKRLPINKSEVKIALISILLLAILVCPFLYIYATSSDVGSSDGFKLDRLFSWFKFPENPGGYPTEWFQYSNVYNIFIIPFLFLGIVFLLIRRKQRDMLLLSWLIAVFIMLHLDVIGLVDFPRVARMLLGEAPIFYSIIVVGIMSITDFIKMPHKKFVDYGLAFLFILVVVLTNGKQAYGLLNGAYDGVARITPAQYELTEWINENLPDDALLYDIGTLAYPKKRFIHVLSHRYLINNLETEKESKAKYGLIDFKPSYVIVDYSDLILIGQDDQIAQINELEKANFGNMTPIYNKNSIKVYEVG